jgi:hypothetical protein
MRGEKRRRRRNRIKKETNKIDQINCDLLHVPKVSRTQK